MPDHTLYIIQIVLQALSSFAIAGGLVYTAVQFRYVRQTQHMANVAKLIEMQMRLRELRVQDPSLADVDTHDVEGINSPQEIREYFLNLMQLSVFELVWYAHQQGQVQDDYYASWVTRMRKVAEEESFRRMVNRPSTKILHDKFERYVRDMVREVEASRR
jgi:hypothetical protein